MKNRILSILLCVAMLFAFSLTYHVTFVSADSGFDVDYDSGGSWDSGSDYSSSKSHSYNSNSKSNSEPTDPRLLNLLFISCLYVAGYSLTSKLIYKDKKANKYFKFIGLIVFLIIVYILFDLDYVLKSFSVYVAVKFFVELYKELFINVILKNKVSPLSQEKLTELKSEGLDIDKIISDSFIIYKDLQIAWMNFDYDKIKDLVNDEMYNMYINQLETLKIKNEQNIMNDIKFENGYIIDYSKENNKETIKIYLSVNCYDYIIETKNKKVVRGNKNKKLSLSYALTFERDVEIVEKCPECGADIKDVTECKYCGSKIVNNNSNMKLVKKEIKKQS